MPTILDRARQASLLFPPTWMTTRSVSRRAYPLAAVAVQSLFSTDRLRCSS